MMMMMIDVNMMVTLLFNDLASASVTMMMMMMMVMMEMKLFGQHDGYLAFQPSRWCLKQISCQWWIAGPCFTLYDDDDADATMMIMVVTMMMMNIRLMTMTLMMMPNKWCFRNSLLYWQFCYCVSEVCAIHRKYVNRCSHLTPSTLQRKRL